MAEQAPEQRKLAAIMFTDMVGYSAMVQRNEAAAIDALEFQVRIGIHMGDVVHRGDKVIGDTVNIAARIEPLAEPGGVSISHQVHDQIYNKFDLPLVKLGRRQLKNIQTPVTIYRVGLAREKSAVTHEALSATTMKWVGAAVLVLLVALSAWRFWFVNHNAAKTIVSSAAGLALSLDPHKIAAWPLESLSPSEESQSFAKALTQELTSKLIDIRALKVMSGAEVSAYKNAGKSFRDLAHDFRVGAVIEGSVSLIGEQLHVLISLADLRNGEALWKIDQSMNFRKIHEIQSIIAERIAETLEVQLLASEKVSLERPPTQNVEAYRLYLQGLAAFDQTDAGTMKAINLFQQAAHLDPKFAEASCGLARGYLYLEKFIEPGHGWADRAAEAIQEALTANQDLAEAHAALGESYFTPARKWDDARAVKELQNAVKLKPNLADAHELLGFIFFHCGFWDASETNLQQTIETHPVNASYLCQPLMYRGNYRESWKIQKQFTNDVSLWDNVWNPAICLDYMKRTDEASALVEAALKFPKSTNHPALVSLQAMFLARAGKTNDALEKIEIAKRGEKRMVHFHHTTYQIASAYALMNDQTNAVEFLRLAAGDGFPCYPYLCDDPNLKNLEGFSPYIEFLEEQKQEWERRRQVFFGGP